jgi:broad specificity phosphatase PhoE
MAGVAAFLRDEPIDAIYSSPLSRAVDSAKFLADSSRSIHLCAGLREIDFGDFEGPTYDEIAERYPDLYRQWMESPAQVQFPNGECLAEMRERVLVAFEEIRRGWRDRTIAIVAHGGVIRALIGWALEMPDDGVFRLAQGYASLSLLAFVDDVPSLQLLNYRPGKSYA